MLYQSVLERKSIRQRRTKSVHKHINEKPSFEYEVGCSGSTIERNNTKSKKQISTINWIQIMCLQIRLLIFLFYNFLFKSIRLNVFEYTCETITPANKKSANIAMRENKHMSHETVKELNVEWMKKKQKSIWIYRLISTTFIGICDLLSCVILLYSD